MPCLKTEKIGIFGGAFDPPHKGHVQALRAFLKTVEPDGVYVIPSGRSPHKVMSGETGGEDRFRMCELAFSGISDQVWVSDLEIASSETSYTFRTVENLRKKHPHAKFYLFIGTDQFLSFTSWRNVDYLLKECILCAMSRDGDQEPLYLQKERLEKEFGAQCLLLEEKAYIISSTQIRKRLQENGFSEDLTPEVNGFIALHGLYGSEMNEKRKEVLSRIRKELGEKRLLHSFAVEREVDRLCRALGMAEEDVMEMRIGALLHDITKEKSKEEHLEILRQKGKRMEEEDLQVPSAWHAITAAALCEDAVSPRVLSAIRYHTTGKENMTIEEKILYLADYMEETRTYLSCRQIRNAFYENLPQAKEGVLRRLDEALQEALEYTLFYVTKNKLPEHPLTRAALTDLEKIRKENK